MRATEGPSSFLLLLQIFTDKVARFELPNGESNMEEAWQNASNASITLYRTSSGRIHVPTSKSKSRIGERPAQQRKGESLEHLEQKGNKHIIRRPSFVMPRQRSMTDCPIAKKDTMTGHYNCPALIQ